jgi:hypothetical protein
MARTKAGKETRLAVVLPTSIVREVKILAAERGETLRETVLRALKADGFQVSAGDIADRRAEANKRRGRTKPEPR